MKWNRRNLLKTAAAFSVGPVVQRWPALAQPSQDGGDTVFVQGALGGGGYACGINISPDGLTRTVRNDTSGLSVWDEKSQTWQQVMKSPNMDACGVRFGSSGNIYEVAVAPSDSSRIYVIASNFKNGMVIGSHSAGMNWMTISRSDDRGA